MNIVHKLLAAFAALALLCAASARADPVTFVKDVPLRAEARFDSPAAGKVSRGTTGEATGKQGAWINVKTSGGAGWVLTTDVSFGSGASPGGGSSGGGFNIFGRTQQTRTTSTVGIRGFDKETIGNAFNESSPIARQQPELLDGYAVDRAGGQSFASAQGLSASSINY